MYLYLYLYALPYTDSFLANINTHGDDFEDNDDYDDTFSTKRLFSSVFYSTWIILVTKFLIFFIKRCFSCLSSSCVFMCTCLPVCISLCMFDGVICLVLYPIRVYGLYGEYRFLSSPNLNEQLIFVVYFYICAWHCVSRYRYAHL